MSLKQYTWRFNNIENEYQRTLKRVTVITGRAAATQSGSRNPLVNQTYSAAACRLSIQNRGGESQNHGQQHRKTDLEAFTYYKTRKLLQTRFEPLKM